MESEQRSATVFAITGMSPLTSTFMWGGSRLGIFVHLGDVLGCVSHSRLHRDWIKDLGLTFLLPAMPTPVGVGLTLIHSLVSAASTRRQRDDKETEQCEGRLFQ